MNKLTDIYDDNRNLACSIDKNEVIGINNIDPCFSEIILKGGCKIGVLKNIEAIKLEYDIN